MPCEDERDHISVSLTLPRAVVEKVILAARRDGRDPASDRERVARALLTNRQRRQDSFPCVAFGEPSWDMILNLYIATVTEHPIDVSSLCAASGVPKTTALRHLDRLARGGLVRRSGDRADARRIFVWPSDALHQRTERWLDHLALSLDLGPP